MRRESARALRNPSPDPFLQLMDKEECTESTVWADKGSPWFAQHRVPGAQMTFFVVHKIHSGGDPVYGRGGETPNGT